METVSLSFEGAFVLLKLIFVGIGFQLSIFLTSCTFFQKQDSVKIREPQQSTGAADIKEIRDITNTFQNIMSAPKDGQRSQEAAHFLQRQRDFYYIAQGLLNNFDEELAKLYHLKMEGLEISNSDKARFLKASYQMRIAWEFSERNSQELIGIYELFLKNANDPKSEYQKACTWIVTNIAKWLDKGWSDGDQASIISLAQDFDDINQEVAADLKDYARF